MPARVIRSLPSRLSCPGSPNVEIVSAPTSHELNSWSVVRCRMGAVRSRLDVAYLQPMPSDREVEDRRPRGLVRSRSSWPSCRWRQSRVDDGVISRWPGAGWRRHQGDRTTRAGQAARSAARRWPAAPSSSCGLVRSNGDRFVFPVGAGARFGEHFGPGASSPSTRSTSGRRLDEIDAPASPARERS
jgi:hypothetical protein